MLQKEEKDKAGINNIREIKWIYHYRDLWFNSEESARNDDNLLAPEVDLITDEELQESLTRMKNRKAAGPDGIYTEFLKYGGEDFNSRLLNFINKCWRSARIPETRYEGHAISIFKKGNRRLCGNYRGISLLNLRYKLYTKIIIARLKPITEALLENHSGFRVDGSCIDNVFSINQIIEKRREYNLETHVAFVDLEKAFDRIERSTPWRIMDRKGYPKNLIKVLINMYKDTKIKIDLGNDDFQGKFLLIEA